MPLYPCKALSKLPPLQLQHPVGSSSSLLAVAAAMAMLQVPVAAAPRWMHHCWQRTRKQYHLLAAKLAPAALNGTVKAHPGALQDAHGVQALTRYHVILRFGLWHQPSHCLCPPVWQLLRQQKPVVLLMYFANAVRKAAVAAA
jgi:hypothetical protein